MTVPIRTCVGCRERHEQTSMVRYRRTADGWAPDTGKHREGRGAYLCSRRCAERVQKNKRYPGLGAVALAQWAAEELVTR